jgi:hypothetical protein
LAYGAAYGPAFCALAAGEGALAHEELANPLAALARSDAARAALRFVLSDSYLDLYAQPAPQSQPDHA